MKNLLALIRILIIVGFAALAAEYFFSTEENSAIATYPEISIFLVFLTIVLIVIEMISYRVEEIAESLLTDEQKAQIAQQEEQSWFGRLYKKLLDQKSLDKESEIILDHNYDGIQELDNNLPPWWVYLFYACVIFAGIYLVRFHFLGGANQEEEYRLEVVAAQQAMEAYKKANPNMIDIENVTLLTDATDLQAGKDIYQTNCFLCHAPDGGGGIGPNLVDEYWILGGGIKNVFKTITEGGRSGKGMEAWKSKLNAKQRQQVASYVLSLQGTTPVSPKPAQGDLWSE
ncbi:cbb3-type cytochrome c oxidase N-terminal domain-containing protein [Capnocytophaga catalasegens]|uniref:Cytochrome c oxidase subunit III n=1 Tax=Capnocytophaga catalasegens TaxID=1004260 RepID=A0AAV5AUF3_9FLAO|nr:cbb3-type cytochrome c oxidase N-terminal domain-containing protein [Capnocytophaga catalasegens]GIZ16150.1 cytochrome c oxidase subunit III [Capnocytophaga catalasegens]GJM50906.1 cytochrome c oxidase subunit III [Capnocytophaga catalasegens]GJM53750.1 cytochrome c oxidase subunit III [Capnocytophaga catalasegens]